MADVVLDSSAVLAMLRGERGGERVVQTLGDAIISAVNYAEVISKLIDFGNSASVALASARQLNLTVAPLDHATAMRAGALHEHTQKRGISLGDRACLALAQALDLPVLTADRAWASLDLGVEVVLIG